VFTPFKTWGMDDTAYTFKTDPNDPSLLHDDVHLYGVPHTTSLASSLMSSQSEDMMSTLDKIFLTDEREILFAELGACDQQA
jgi:hypothetical protein